MKYHCEHCNYSTEEKQNWYCHKKTKKHLNNKSSKEAQEKNKEISNQNEKIELNKKDDNVDIILIKKDHEIELLKQKLIFLEKELENKNTQFKNLQTENEFHKQLISSAGGLIEKSMNTFNYLLLNYNSAPHINKLNDYTTICQNNEKLIKSLIYYFNKKKLSKYIGDFIIKNYKKNQPELQSFWSSDVGRLNYIIKELIENNKKEFESKWTIDKKGVKMTKYIIEPILEYVKNININYINQNKLDEDQSESEENSKILKQSITLGLINTNINNNELSNEINKYIAPFFFFDKNGIVKK